MLERRATKQEILELYLNEIYLGQSGSFSINGVGEAARMYFHKDVANLTLPESALLAGMIQSPNPYNPFRHEKRATERRNEVAARHAARPGFIDRSDDGGGARGAAARRAADASTATDAPYFVDLVRQQLAAALRGEGPHHPEPLDLHDASTCTCRRSRSRRSSAGLDRVQEMIKKRTTAAGPGLPDRPRAGERARSWRSWAAARTGASQYNRVMQARRQPGSTFKPFVYLAAFEATFDDPSLPPITPATVVEDAPAVFFYEDKEYIPTNYEDTYHGHGDAAARARRRA